MAYNRSQAQKLCSATELELFMASLAEEIIQLTPAQLRSKVTRTRTLRDKKCQSVSSPGDKHPCRHGRQAWRHRCRPAD